MDTVPSSAPVTAAPHRAAPAICLDGLTKRYGDRAVVSDLTFDVPVGTVCGFIGPNGAGKTTTLRMLLGLIAPSAGSASVLGHPTTSPISYMRQVGAMIEGPAFYPTLSGQRNLEVLAALAGVERARVDHVLATVDMAERASDPFKSYSLGMKQRIGIAAALLGDPSLLILDEPTNGLDPPGIREVRDLIRGLADEGKTVLVSSHLLDELQHVSDHIVIINHGALLFEGTVDALVASRRSTLTIRPERPADLRRLVELCTAAGHRTTDAGGFLQVEADPTWAGPLNRAAMDEGIVLNSLVATQPRLEDIFFELTDEAPR